MLVCSFLRVSFVFPSCFVRVAQQIRMIPQPQEVAAYREFERSGRSIDEMTDEDKFLFQITKCERLEQKLRVCIARN